MGSKNGNESPLHPGVGGATDHKTIDNDPHTHEEDKQALQTNPHAQPMIPGRGVNPALRELREKKHVKPSGEA